MRFLECLKSVAKIHGNNYLWSMMKKSSVSGMQRFMYFRILCYVLERCKEPNIKYCLGRTVELVQRFITLQNFGHDWRRADGMRVEYFPRFTTLQLISKVQEFMTKMGDPSQIKGRIIFMSMFNDLSWWYKDRNGMYCQFHTCVSVIPRTWIRKEVVFYWCHRPQGDWDRVAELMMIKFRESRHPVLRATSPSFPRNAQKATEVENYQDTSVPMVIRLKLFFAQLFLFMSLSSVQCQICVMNTVLVKQERWDPCWQDDLTPCSSHQDCWWQHPHLRLKFLHEILLQKYKERVERLSQQDRVIKICTNAGFLTTVEVGQYFMTKDTE